jgi:hypothetical protein
MVSALTVSDQLIEIIQNIKRPSRGRNLLFFSSVPCRTDPARQPDIFLFDPGNRIPINRKYVLTESMLASQIDI